MTLPSSSALDHCQKCVAMFKIWTLMLIKIAVEIEWMDWCNSILIWCGYGPCTKPESAKRGMEGLASTAGAATAESIVQQGNVVRQSIKPRFEQGVVVMLTLAVCWNVNTNTWQCQASRQAGNIAGVWAVENESELPRQEKWQARQDLRYDHVIDGTEQTWRWTEAQRNRTTGV